MTKYSENKGRLDVITLRDLRVECVIGIHPEEKIKTQILKIDVRMYLDTQAAAFSGILSRTVDYSLVAKQLTFILTHSRFRLLEGAAEALAVFLLTPPKNSGNSPLIEAVDIEIDKPEALGGQAFPSVRIYREKSSPHLGLDLYSATEIDSEILFQVPEAVLERTYISAGMKAPHANDPAVAYMKETEDEALPSHKISILKVTFRGQTRFIQREERLH